MLRAGDAPPLDYAALLDQCRRAVSDRVYRSLEELTVRSEDGGFVSRWAVFYRVLQGELTYQRRVKRGESCAAPNERDAAVTQTVTAAVNAKDPLEGERTAQLRRLRALRLRAEAAAARTAAHLPP